MSVELTLTVLERYGLPAVIFGAWISWQIKLLKDEKAARLADQKAFDVERKARNKAFETELKEVYEKLCEEGKLAAAMYADGMRERELAHAVSLEKAQVLHAKQIKELQAELRELTLEATRAVARGNSVIEMVLPAINSMTEQQRKLLEEAVGRIADLTTDNVAQVIDAFVQGKGEPKQLRYRNE